MDYSAIAAAITSEVTGALPDFAGLMAIVIGVPLAWKLVKRVVR
jgi:hypothetical protein